VASNADHTQMPCESASESCKPSGQGACNATGDSYLQTYSDHEGWSPTMRPSRHPGGGNRHRRKRTATLVVES